MCMFLDVYDLVRIICEGNHNILSVFEAYFVLQANPVKTTPSLIINPIPNRICLTSFGLSFISC